MATNRKTCRRWNDSGHAHALTFSCFKRQSFLSRDRSREWMLEGIERARTAHLFHLWAYVVMPEHVHLLIWPSTAEYSVSAVLKTMKQSVSRKALLFVRQHAPAFLSRMEDRQPNGRVSYRFWQRGGGYDRNLTEPSGVVLLMGTNDIEEGASPETIAGNVNLITDLLKEHNPQMPIILCLILPSSGSMKRPASTISKTNKYFIELAKSKPQITILDTWSMFATEQGDARLAEIPDLVHPNQLGYAKWATALRPMLAEIISRNCVIERRFASTLD